MAETSVVITINSVPRVTPLRPATLSRVTSTANSREDETHDHELPLGCVERSNKLDQSPHSVFPFVLGLVTLEGETRSRFRGGRAVQLGGDIVVRVGECGCRFLTGHLAHKLNFLLVDGSLLLGGHFFCSSNVLGRDELVVSSLLLKKFITMSDGDSSTAFSSVFQSSLNHALGFGVQSGCSFVKEQNYNHKGENLALRHSSHILQFALLFLVCGLMGSANQTVTNVVEDGGTKERGFLADESHLLTQPSEVKLRNIMSVQINSALNRIVETFNQSNNGTLAGTRCAHQSGNLAGRDIKTHVLHDSDFRSRRVDVLNVGKSNGALNLLELLACVAGRVER
ncbi:hypothetical protein HG531_011556 [Fusarium graminearum]|nr:hypothetical protein HG531_011556 [Fusarium graminearum]